MKFLIQFFFVYFAETFGACVHLHGGKEAWNTVWRGNVHLVILFQNSLTKPCTRNEPFTKHVNLFSLKEISSNSFLFRALLQNPIGARYFLWCMIQTCTNFLAIIYIKPFTYNSTVFSVFFYIIIPPLNNFFKHTI